MPDFVGINRHLDKVIDQRKISEMKFLKNQKNSHIFCVKFNPIHILTRKLSGQHKSWDSFCDGVETSLLHDANCSILIFS